MKFLASTAICLSFLLSQASSIAVPFTNSEFSLHRRNNQLCPRTTKRYEWCDAVTRCCMPGYGCNTGGHGNVGQSCVKREKDGCKSDKDCYWSQKCINNGKESSFCAQLWVDTPPKHKPSKTALLPAASSFAGSFGNSASSFAMGASSFAMASSFMMAPTGMVGPGRPMPAATMKPGQPAPMPKMPGEGPKGPPMPTMPAMKPMPTQA